MALGTGSITLNQVRIETESASDSSLSENFTAATGVFDSNYEGSKDRLSNFKGYNHISYTPRTYYITDTECGARISTTVYVLSTYATLAAVYDNAPMYTTAAATTYAAGKYYYKDYTDLTWYVFNKDNDGLWDGTGTCTSSLSYFGLNQADSESEACEDLAKPIDAWHDGANEVIAVGDIIYQDAAGSSTFGGFGWGFYIIDSTRHKIYIGEFGEVSSVGTCV